MKVVPADITLSQAQEAKHALQATGRAALPHKEPQKKLSERNALKEEKPKS